MAKPLNPGHGWVAAQTLLAFLQLLQPLVWKPLGLPDLRWGPLWSGPEPWLGAGLVAAAGGLLAWATRSLGRSLSPLPRPLDDAVLVVRGPYRWIRHPIYTSLLLAFAGWALVWKDPALVVGFGCLLVVFTFKSRLEEKWLVTRYPDYEAYRSRTGGLFPRW